jgi:hypothetical protein
MRNITIINKMCGMQVVEAGLGHLPFSEKSVVTPTGAAYVGVDFAKKLCGVSIIRSGESMENALRACCNGIKIGKILVHRCGMAHISLSLSKWWKCSCKGERERERLCVHTYLGVCGGVHMCTHRDMGRVISSRIFSCSSYAFFDTPV